MENRLPKNLLYTREKKLQTTAEFQNQAILVSRDNESNYKIVYLANILQNQQMLGAVLK